MLPQRLRTSGARWSLVRLGAAAGSLAAFAAFGGAAPAVAGKPVTVCASGCAFATIQDAVAAVQAGATIQLGGGTYAGGFTIDKDLTLRGASASETTISGGTPVVTVSPDVTATVRDVTITSGFDRAGAVVNGGALALQGVTISGSQAFDPSHNGGGIYNTGNVTLDGSTLSGNAAESDGGGIFNAGGTVTMHGSTAADNRAQDGAAVFTVGGTVTIDNSLLNGNTAADGGSGGGIFKGSSGVLTVRVSTISANSAQGFGGGIYSADNKLTLQGTQINGNAAARCGGGISVSGALSSVLSDTTISGNVATAFEDAFNPPGDSC